jgi:hypothetical protein
LIEGKILESHHKVQIAFRRIKSRSGSGAEEVDAAHMALAADAFQLLALFFYLSTGSCLLSSPNLSATSQTAVSPKICLL